MCSLEKSFSRSSPRPSYSSSPLRQKQDPSSASRSPNQTRPSTLADTGNQSHGCQRKDNSVRASKTGVWFNSPPLFLLDSSFYIKLHALGASDLVAVKVCAIHVGESETILIRNFPTQQFFKAKIDGNSEVFFNCGAPQKMIPWVYFR